LIKSFKSQFFTFLFFFFYIFVYQLKQLLAHLSNLELYLISMTLICCGKMANS